MARKQTGQGADGKGYSFKSMVMVNLTEMETFQLKNLRKGNREF